MKRDKTSFVLRKLSWEPILDWYCSTEIPILLTSDEIGVYLGVKTCEVFLCFVAIVRVRAIVLTSLFSLFYVTGECRRFLHRRWARNRGLAVSCQLCVAWMVLPIRFNNSTTTARTTQVQESLFCFQVTPEPFKRTLSDTFRYSQMFLLWLQTVNWKCWPVRVQLFAVIRTTREDKSTVGKSAVGKPACKI